MTTHYTQTLKKLHLLFIDDDISISADVHALFSPLFKSVHLAHDIDAAMDIYHTQYIDIIISDIKLKKNKSKTIMNNHGHPNNHEQSWTPKNLTSYLKKLSLI